MLLRCQSSELSTSAFIAEQGSIFAVFDDTTQDSGNESYGVRYDTASFFVKTAGKRLNAKKPQLTHGARVSRLRSAVRLARSIVDEALPTLLNVVECCDGPLLVYEWVEGELIGTPAARRSDPASAFGRFRSLPLDEATAALEAVFRLHAKLAQRGWVAGDFYAGCLVYDFVRQRLRVIDLDHYREGPYVNTMGRMFGSTRFMAPEDQQLGGVIDERTTVFTLGRTIQQLLGAPTAAITDVARRACEMQREHRFGTVAELYEAWAAALRSRT